MRRRKGKETLRGKAADQASDDQMPAGKVGESARPAPAVDARVASKNVVAGAELGSGGRHQMRRSVGPTAEKMGLKWLKEVVAEKKAWRGWRSAGSELSPLDENFGTLRNVLPQRTSRTPPR